MSRALADEALLLRIIDWAFEHDQVVDGQPTEPAVPSSLTEAAIRLRPTRHPKATVTGHRWGPSSPTGFGRYLPAVAGSGSRQPQIELETPGQPYLTRVRETSAGRILLTVRSSMPEAGLVRVRWTRVAPTGIGPTVALVTPLADTARGAVAEYDLGPADDVAGLDVEPACSVAAEDLTHELVGVAFELTQHGSARRAWHAYAARLDASSRMRAHIRSLLEP